MPSVEQIFLNALGPCQSIGGAHQDDSGPNQCHWWEPGNNCECTRPIQEHRGCPLRQILGPSNALSRNNFGCAGPCQSIGGTYRDNSGHDQCHQWEPGNNCECTGPRQGHWWHPPRQSWAQAMSSVELILDVLGPCQSTRGTCRDDSGPN